MKQENSIDLGDKRLNKRANELITNIQNKNTVVLHKAANGWSQEVAYGRFLKNPNVTFEELKQELLRGVSDSVENRHVLIIQDSSELNYAHYKDKITGLGKVGDGRNEGFEIHPNLVLDAENTAIYGISDLHVWKRNEEKNTSNQRVYKSSEEKEIGRWISTAKNSITTCEKASMRTVICDREGDFYELLYTLPDISKNNHILVRNRFDRKLSEGDETLWESIEKAPVQGIYEIDLPRTDKRSAHHAILEVKYQKIKVKRPRVFWDKNAPKEVELYVIEVKEQAESVVNKEQPIHWRLLTTHAITSLEEARLAIDWYCLRWWIEQLFRVLKSKGIRIEDSQIEDYERLIKLVVITMIALVRTLQLTKARQGTTNQKITAVFTEEETLVLVALCKKYEGKTEKQKNPHSPHSLAYASWVIARLGGWKGYASQVPAGPITMYQGLQKFQNIVEGWQLVNQI